jgi:acyl carrier protein
MNENTRQALRAFLSQTLEGHGDSKPFADDESLFLSGRLDSFTMMNLVMFLEETFGVDFGAVDFEVELVDTVEAILALVAERKKG